MGISLWQYIIIRKGKGMDELKAIYYILIANTIIAMLYPIFMHGKVNSKQLVLAAIFMLFCPVIGAGYLFFSWLIYQIFFRKREGLINLEELSFNKNKIDVISAPELKEERDKVPIEDALILPDRFTKRDVLLRLLKSDYDQSINFVASAVENEDGEVSHYAASAVTEKIAEFKAMERSLNKDRIHDIQKNSLPYIEYVNNFLAFHILSDPEQAAYSKKVIESIKDLQQLSKESMSGKVYQRAIMISMDAGDFDGAKMWLDLALRDKPDSLRVYKAGLKYYFKTEAYDNFLELLERLKKSDIILDNQTLELIRFYQPDTILQNN